MHSLECIVEKLAVTYMDDACRHTENILSLIDALNVRYKNAPLESTQTYRNLTGQIFLAREPRNSVFQHVFDQILQSNISRK